MLEPGSAPQTALESSHTACHMRTLHGTSTALRIAIGPRTTASVYMWLHGLHALKYNTANMVVISAIITHGHDDAQGGRL